MALVGVEPLTLAVLEACIIHQTTGKSFPHLRKFPEHSDLKRKNVHENEGNIFLHHKYITWQWSDAMETTARKQG